MLNNFIDYDLSIVPSDQAAGCLEQELVGDDFEYAFPDRMVPRSQWNERIDRVAALFQATTTQIYSQGNEGSCVGFAICQALETFLRRAYGVKHWISLSGMSVYKRIGRSPQSGAYINDGMNAVKTEGALPVNSADNTARFKHTHPRTGFGNPLPSGWQETGRLFRVLKSVTCRGTDQIISALLHGATGIVGRQGHAVPYCVPARNGNRYFAKYANSWGNWGENGWGYDSESILSSITMLAIVEVYYRPDMLPDAPQL